MKKTLILTVAIVFGLALMLGGAPADVQAKTTFVTIGTGGITGVYYPTGGAIAKMVNAKRDVYGIRATVESTGGSAFNINAVMAGDLEFGVAQSDRQFQAFNGTEGSEWAGKPQPDLRAVFSIHAETVDLIASVDSGINSLATVIINDLIKPLRRAPARAGHRRPCARARRIHGTAGSPPRPGTGNDRGSPAPPCRRRRRCRYAPKSR